MPVTVVSVCNSALVKVGADRISSITQDTKSAKILNAIFNTVRDDVLRAHRWNFAMTRATLAPTGTEPDFEYDYQYDLPSDCLRIVETYPDDIDFVVEGRTILSNESELSVVYIRRNEDPASWDSCFAEALAWRLAREVAYNLTQSNALVKQCDDAYKAQLAEARSIDGAEGIIKGLEADVWTRARR